MTHFLKFFVSCNLVVLFNACGIQDLIDTPTTPPVAPTQDPVKFQEVTILEPENLANFNHQFELKVECEPNFTLNIYINGVLQQEHAESAGECPPIGQYSKMLTLNGSDGEKEIIIEQYDPKTQHLSRSTRVIVKDSKAPLLSLLKPEEASAVKLLDLIIEGGCESALKIEINGDLVQNLNIACNAKGTFQQLVKFTTGDGAKKIFLKQEDAAGNKTEISRTVTLDTTPLILTIDQPINNQHINQTTVEISGRCKAAGENVEISGDLTQNHSVTCAPENTYSQTVHLSTEDGTKSIQVTQQDRVRNQGIAVRAITLDTLAPALNVDQLASPLSLPLTLQADQATEISGPMKIAQSVRASNAAFIHVPKGKGSQYNLNNKSLKEFNELNRNKTIGLARYEIFVDRAGKYDLWGRLLAKDVGSDSFYVQVNEGPLKEWHTTIGPGRNSSNYREEAPFWFWQRFSNLELKNGLNTLRIIQREDGTRLDVFHLSANKNYRPSYTYSNLISLSGNCEMGLPINISSNDLEENHMISCDEGSFRTDVSLYDKEFGIKNIQISQQDLAGNTKLRTLNFEYKKTHFAKLTAGYNHNCGIDATAQLHCWGWNSNGQSDVPPEFKMPAQAVSAGGHFTCAADATNQLLCWGWNAYGQLNVPEGFAIPPQTLSAGTYHVCGIDAKGQLHCWGMNHDRQSHVPDDFKMPAQAISAGGNHSCGIDAKGQLHCWGKNNNRQSHIPNEFKMPAQAISAGFVHTCGIDAAGELHCWGGNVYGQRDIPEKFKMPAQAVSAGFVHTCGIDAKGELHCWGANFDGQSKIPNDFARPAQAISAGGSHTSGFDAKGKLHCWGANHNDQCAIPELY